MATSNKITQGKRNRERSLKERQQEKEERRLFRKEQKKTRDDSSAEGIDPDLVGIFPGPQPPRED